MKKAIQSLLAVTIIISAFTLVTTKSYAQYVMGKSYAKPSVYLVQKLGGGYDFYGSDYTLKGFSVPKKHGGYDFYGSDYRLKGYTVPKINGGYDIFGSDYSLKGFISPRLGW